jgi:hypothetical protein
MPNMALRGGTLIVALALAPALPVAAQAAQAPSAVTRGAADVTPQTARLTGSVDPNGASTTYQFQYGTTSSYGAVTPAVVLTGDGARNVTADVAALAPATTYHYRLVARNAKGVSRGADRTLRTLRQPLGVTLAGVPNPVPFGGTTTLAGQLTGTGNGGRVVVLQSNPFPYTQGFQPLGNALLTDPAGNFSFGLLAVPFNTQYRVQLPDAPAVVSPIVVVSVSVRVSTRVSASRVTRGGRLTFSGTVTPAVDGTPIAIQKLNGAKRWVTVAGTAARHRSARTSSYRKSVTIRRGGSYRVYIGVATGTYVPNTGRTVRIRTT